MTSPPSSPSSPRQLLVVGSMRSGTTLLNRLLGAHPKIAMIYHPTRFFESAADLRHLGVSGFLGRFREQYGFFGRVGPEAQARCEQALGALPEDAAKGEIYRALTRGLVDKADALVVGEKYAGRGAEVLPFRSLLPDGKVILIVRDPRDVLLSNKKRIEQEADMENYWAGSHLMAVDDWVNLAVLHRSLDQVQGGAYLQIRYEDLVTDPTGTLGAVCEFLGVPFAEEMVQPGSLRHEDGRAWKANTSHGRPYEGVTGESVGAFRDELTAGEVMFVDALVVEHLRFFGYEPDPPRTDTETLAAACALFLRLGGILRRYSVPDPRLYNLAVSEDENLGWFVEKLVAFTGLDQAQFTKGFLVGRALGARSAEVWTERVGKLLAEEIVAHRRSFEYVPQYLDALRKEIRDVRGSIERHPSVLNVVKRMILKRLRPAGDGQAGASAP